MNKRCNQVKMPYNATPLQDVKRVFAAMKNQHVAVESGRVRLYYNGGYCAGFAVFTGTIVCDLMWSDPEFGRHGIGSYDAKSFLSGLDALTMNRVLGTKMVKNSEVPDILKSARWYVDLQFKPETRNTHVGQVTETVALVQRVVKVQSFVEVE